MTADMPTIYSACPNHPGQWFHKSTHACSCGAAHKEWQVIKPCAVKGTDNHSNDRVTVFDGRANPVTACGYHASHWGSLFSWEYVERNQTEQGK